MTKDLNKGIQGILYNSLNLPQEMVISHVSARAKNYYTYTANGTKIRVVHKSDPALNGDPQLGSTSTDASLTTSITTDYIGNKIYQDGVLKTILTDNGYIEGGIYYFYIKDHLGNNRIVANSSGNVIQSTQYYPFGMAFGENTTTEQGKQDFKYNGKELDRAHELNQYDYAARYYDPGYGRFTTIDPLAEKFYNWSPYVYTFNNPMRFTDPTGMAPEDGFLNDLLKAINQAGQQILSTVGLSNDQLQSENPVVRADASQKREQATETLHTVNESMLSVMPGADVAYKVANDREVTKSDVAWAVAGMLPVGKIGKVAKVAEGAGNVAKEGKTILNFTETTAKHMDEAGRYVPVQILDDAIKTTKGVADPLGSRALMHTTEMVKNGKTYNLEVLYDKATNSVWHFKYSPIKK